jgi:peroxiredoxin
MLAGWIALGAAPVALQGQGTKEEKPAEKPVDKPAEKKAAEIGKPAPDFTLKDLDGKTVKLADFKGKTVVLEWFNPDCPAVVAGHTKGTLKDMAAKATADSGVVWLAVNSGGEGKQGHAVDANKKRVDEWKIGHPILRDESGEIGKAYGAKTTPHMFVVDAKGVLVYRGAPDNAPMGKAENDKLENHVETVLADLKAGKTPSVKESRSYG